MKFKFKLALTIFLISILSLVITIGVFSVSTNSSTIETELRTNQENVQYISETVERYLKDIVRLTETIASSDVIEEYLISSNEVYDSLSPQDRLDNIAILNSTWANTTDLEDQFIKDRMENDAALYLATQQENSPDLFGELFLTNKYGLAISTTGKLTSLAHYDKYWWQGAYNNGDGTIYIDDRGFDESVSGYVLGIVIPIYDEDNQIIGVLKSNFNISQIFDDSISFFHNSNSDGNFYVVRTLGLIINGESIEPLSEEINSSITPYLDDNLDLSFEHEIDNTKYMLSISPISITFDSDTIIFGGSYDSFDHSLGNQGEGWSVIYLVNNSSVLSGVNRFFVIVALAGLLGVSLLTLLSLILGGTLSKPISNLNDYIQRIGSGDITKENLKITKDEIGELTTSFNNMIDHLNETLVSKNDLMESEEKLKIILNSTADGIYGVDLDGICTFVNNSFLNILGYDDDRHFIGSNMHEIIHHHYIDGTEHTRNDCEVEMAAIRGEKGIIGESILWKKDGTYVNVEFSSNPQFKDGEMVGAVVAFKDITDKLKAEKELATEKDLAKEYLNTAGVIMLVLNPKGVVELINSKGCSIIGLEQSDIVGKNWFENFVPQYNRKEMKAIFEKVFDNEFDLLSKYENTIITSDGEERLISWTNSVLHDSEGNIISLLASGEDVTEFKKANDKLIESERRFRSLFERAPFGYQSLDENGIFIEVNQKWLQTFGYKKEEVLGKWFGDFLLPDHRKEFEKRFNKFKNDGSIYSEFLMKTKFGKTIQVGFNGDIGYDENKGFKQTHCTVQDVTEINVINERLKYETELAQKYLNLAGVMIVVLDTRGYITLMNKKGCDIIGLEEKDIVGKNWFDNFISKEFKKDVMKVFIDVFKDNPIIESHNENFIVNAKGEERLISWNNSILHDPEGDAIGIISAGEDITDSSNKQKILIESEERLNRSQSIAQVGSWELDVKTNLVWASAEAFSIYEIPQESSHIDFDRVQSMITGPDRTMMSEALNNLIEKGQEYDVVFSLQTESKTKWVHSQAEITYDSAGNPKKVLGVIRDISQTKEYEKSLIEMSNHDFLTGLYNRRFFVEEYNRMDNPEHYPLGVMMIDVNGLKIINDAFGHGAGDLALKKVSAILKKSMRKQDIIARIGGDEFAIIFPKISVDEIENLKVAMKKETDNEAVKNIVLSVATGYEIKDAEFNGDLDEVLKLAENHMYRHKLAEGASVRNNTIKAIFKTLTDKYTEERVHSVNVSKLCKQIGEKMELNEYSIKELELAGMYHDIGKISIPDAILNKPGRLTNDEYEKIKTHPEISYQILRAADEYSDLAIHALHHHERWDGKGYPNGKKGENIPLFSRIICIADSYEAMTSVRVYKEKMSKLDAVNEIIRCSGTQFDKSIAKIFVEEVLGLPWS
jgi:diguanylate cyclase (GGDEF)-like protein/PAS domain S-box-containing protein